jgi:hypothetical protein
MKKEMKNTTNIRARACVRVCAWARARTRQTDEEAQEKKRRFMLPRSRHSSRYWRLWVYGIILSFSNRLYEQ